MLADGFSWNGKTYASLSMVAFAMTAPAGPGRGFSALISRRRRCGREERDRQAGSLPIYTRVSTDHGLEQDFNSLDAQHDAAQAYIRSQAHAGWTLIRPRYDDGGYSGGSTECCRPAAVID